MILRQESKRGFSLIELSVLLIIIGLVSASALEVYRDYLNEKFRTDVADRIGTKTKNALVDFVTKNRRFPCPADPSMQPDNPFAGFEVCLRNGGETALNYCGSLPASTPGRVCRVAGNRNTDSVAGNENVLIGSVPYATLGISPQDAVDPWNNKFTYGVSERLTYRDAPGVHGYANLRGVINLRGTSQDSVTGAVSGVGNLIGPAGQFSYEFVVFSHGPDGKGAYTYNGRLKSACTGVERDVENCDYDSVFVLADNDSGIQSRQAGAFYFDDLNTLYEVATEEDKWVYFDASSMKTKDTMNVGIGTTTPVQRLHVAGNIKAGDTTAGYDVLGSRFCSLDGSCFAASMIGGVGINCGSSGTPGLMTGISSNDVLCAQAVNPTGLTAASCPTGQYITGINPSGVIQCAAP
jgi:prepilin-type N-terminal cleavage/methylation domain-containing protein